MTEEIESVKDKIARQDHDAIIRMEGKLDNLSADLKSNNNDIMAKILQLGAVQSAQELRIAAIEKVNVENLQKTTSDNALELRDYKTGMKWIRAFVGIIGAMVLYLIALVSGVFKVFRP